MLGRLLKHIGAMGYIKRPILDGGLLHLTQINSVKGLLPACLHSPAYLTQTNYATPTDVRSGAFQSAFKTEKNMFEYLTAHPPLGQQFNHHMGGYRLGRPSWMDPGFYPVNERLVQGMAESDATLLVDIGGSLGHDLQEFATKYPNEPGHLIERTKCDFYTDLPVKAARAYYLHSILHDWPDQVCKVNLKQVAGAMEPGYSKLLIHENIIPSKGAEWEATALDIMMATLLSSKDRTEEEWYALL
ncbi:hypothetical protein PMIN04_012993 [Paraphaeosphaeria minitans]